MRRKRIRRLSLFITALMIAASVTSMPGQDVPTPRIGGKSIDDWVALLDKGRPEEKVRGTRALGFVGDQAARVVPALAGAVNDPDEDVRYGAVTALGMIGRAASGALPAMVAKLGDDSLNVVDLIGDSKPLLISTIAGFGEAAAPLLAAALRDDDPRVRFRAAYALCQIGLAAGVAVPALTDRVFDSDWLVRRTVIEALTRIGPAARKAIPTLYTAWEKEDISNPEVFQSDSIPRRIAAALAALGAKPPAGLVRELSSADSARRREAVGWLAEFGPEAKPEAALVEKLLSDADEDVRFEAAVTLSKIDPPGRAAVDRLVLMLTDGEATRRSEAATTLGEMGPAAREAIPSLTGLLRDEDIDVREDAVIAIADIDPTNQQVVAAIVDLLGRRKTDPHDFGLLARAAAKFGPLARAAVPALGDALNTLPFYDRGTLEAIVQIDPYGERSAQPLAEALLSGKDGSGLRWRLIGALKDFGVGAKAVIPNLIKMLANHDPLVQVGAASTLGRIGPRAEAAVPRLIKSLEAGDRRVSSASAEAIGLIATADRAAAVEALARKLRDDGDHPDVNVVVAQCRLDPAYHDRAAVLAEASKDFYFRAAVLGAVGRESPEARGFARLILRRLDEVSRPPSPSIPRLISILEDLGGLGAGAKSAIPRVTSLQNSPDPRVRHAAAVALTLISARVN
jgi:HEAT repeat protein